MVDQGFRAAEQIVKRSSSRAVSAFMYACAGLVGIAAIFLLVGGFRVIILNQGFRLSSDKEGTINITFSTDARSLKDRIDTLQKNLGTWRDNAREEDKPKFFKSSAIADQNGSFNCDQGYYMIGLTFKNNNLPQILCRPIAELAP